MTAGNIVLIGMPSSGKSTVGRLLAKKINYEFIDTDKLIMEKVNKPLKDLVNEDGLEKFLDIQEKTILETSVDKHVIATGGSVIYSEKSMNHLKKNSVIVYLETDMKELADRITSDRRLARNENQSFQEMYEERKLLYEKYADITVNCTNRKPEDIADELVKKLEGSK